MPRSLTLFLWMALGIGLPLVYSTHVYEGALLPRLAALQAGLIVICICALFDAPRLNTRALLASGALLASMGLSITQSINVTESVLQFAHYSTLALIPIVAVATLKSSDLDLCIGGWVWGALPVTVIGISQYLGLGWADLPSRANPSATFFHRNAAAEYLIALIPFAWYSAHRARTARFRIGYTTITLLCCTYLVFTRCRGAWIGIGVASLIVWLISRRVPNRPSHDRPKRRLMGPAIAVVIVAAALIPDRIAKPGAQHFDEKKDSALTAAASIVDASGHRGRLDLWSHTLRIGLDHPLLGVGLGNWEFVYPDYAWGDQVNVNASPRRPHNDLLWILSETGAIGLAAYLGFLLIAFRSGLRALHDPEHRLLAVAGLVVLLAQLGDGVFNFPRERVSPAFLFWSSVGILLILDPGRSVTTRFARLQLGLIASVLIVGGYLTVKRLTYDIHHLNVHRAERKQDWDGVLGSGARAAAIGSYRANTFIAVGRAQDHQGRPSQAIDAYRRALELHPNSINAHNNVAIALRKTGSLEEAEHSARRAIELYPNFIEAHNNLGNIYRDGRKWPSAIRSLERALELAPHNPLIRVNLGRTLALSGDLRGAERQFRNALVLSPEFAPALRSLQQLLNVKDDRDKN